MATLDDGDRTQLDALIRKVKELLEREASAAKLCEASVPAPNLCDDCRVCSMCRAVITSSQWGFHDVTKHFVVEDRRVLEDAEQALVALKVRISKAERKPGPGFRCGDCGAANSFGAHFCLDGCQRRFNSECRTTERNTFVYLLLMNDIERLKSLRTTLENEARELALGREPSSQRRPHCHWYPINANRGRTEFECACGKASGTQQK